MSDATLENSQVNKKQSLVFQEIQCHHLLALDFLLLIFILYFLINLCNKDKGIDSKY